ncbi:MAG: arginine--tRNA ligase [Bdellovibrionaceae bacterium]|nr:arginine--tRNA ligase [Pseudobdellovibrionaceae bacterium]
MSQALIRNTEFSSAGLDAAATTIYDLLVEPPQKEMGDLALGLFPYAKALKQGPPTIAAKLVQEFSSSDLFSVQVAGPYLNFRFTMKAFAEWVLNPILDGRYFTRPIYMGAPKTMIEFSQPNTHKELHVGHMRNLCLGDALVKTLRFSGQDIVTSTFPGDVGTHVAKCLWYMKYHNTEPVPTKDKGEWLGRMYSAGHNKLESEKASDKTEFQAQLTEILKQLESKNGPFYDLWKETREWSIQLMKSVYDWAGVSFDIWYWESDVDSSSVEFIKQVYQQQGMLKIEQGDMTKGKIVESKGAIGMDLNAENLGFCMLLKSDGTGLYATKDIELARRKFTEHKIEKSIYVVDLRQALHFQQVFKVLEKLGFEQAKNCYHLQYNFVELPDGAMSSRKGNIVPIMALINQMQEKIIADYLVRYRGEWAEDEITKTAHKIAQGAIKYGMLRQDPGKKIVFEMTEWLKLDGESGPFIQYSYARIQSLLEKVAQVKSSAVMDGGLLHTVSWETLTEKSEHELVQFLSYFHHYVYMSAENYKPSTLCGYLYDLAKRFNYFYHECPIAQAPTDQLRQARVCLARATGMVLEKGLSILGIPVPQRM